MPHQFLYQNNFPVPVPYEVNRHCVVMSLIDGFPLNQVTELENPLKVYESCVEILTRLFVYNYIHCDFNEFNLIVDCDSKVHLIDFPQMVSTTHINADFYFERDFKSIKNFFCKRFNLNIDTSISLQALKTVETEINQQLEEAQSAEVEELDEETITKVEYLNLEQDHADNETTEEPVEENAEISKKVANNRFKKNRNQKCADAFRRSKRRSRNKQFQNEMKNL